MADEGLDEVWFKRTDGGWIFKLSKPFLFGPPDYFFVNCAQKAAIAIRLRSNRWMRMAVILPAILLSAPLGCYLPLPKLPALAGALMTCLCVYALFVSVNVVAHYRLRPLLAGLPRAAGTIRLSDQIRCGTRLMPLHFVFLFFALFASKLILGLALLGHRGILHHGFGLVIYGAGALCCGALLVAKLAAYRVQD